MNKPNNQITAAPKNQQELLEEKAKAIINSAREINEELQTHETPVQRNAFIAVAKERYGDEVVNHMLTLFENNIK